MIFMSQSGITEPERERDWDAWYVEHLALMLTVPGIRTAQRFRALGAGYPPSLALYSVASVAVFEDPHYLAVRGMGKWRALIDERYYRRNLFEGLAFAPEVPAGALLAIADRERPGPSPVPLTWLRAIGLDRSTAYRGIAVLERAAAARLEASGIELYWPVTERARAR